jgi:hypothetical protein
MPITEVAAEPRDPEAMTSPITDVEAGRRDCEALTSMRQERRPGVFDARLRSVHDLSFERSSFRRSPFEAFLQSLLTLWWQLRDALSAVHARLFPRRERVYGSVMDSLITGRLTFGQKTRDETVPVHHMRVEIWARTMWGGYRMLGCAFTDRDGRFEIHHDLCFARSWWIRSVRAEVYTTGNHRFADDRPVADYVRFKSVPINRKDLVGTTYDAGTVQLFYWEYDYSAATPRVIIKDHDLDAPQRYSPKRVEAMERQVLPFELIRMEHLEEIADAPGRLTIPVIQASYPENLTVCMERRHPGITRGDDWFGERMMNGMYASEFDRDPTDPELLWLHYHWSSYEHTTDYAIPNVDMWFRLGEDGLPKPVRIRLTGALNAYELDVRPRPQRTFTPDDAEQWMYAKRIARVSSALVTELGHHFAGTHLNTEQYAIAAYRNLRLSPLTTLLFPHVKEVALIDHTADKILVGKGYIQRATALTPEGINQAVVQRLGSMDWKGFRPMQPLSQAHTYARAANLYWDLVAGYVSDYMEEHAAGIQEQWFETCRFARELVQHSVPAFLCGYLHKALHDASGTVRAPAETVWYQPEQRLRLPLEERPIMHGVPRALSLITGAERFEDAPAADWENLKQACTYIIFQSTFAHTWANSKQYDDIGEVLYNSLGLRFGVGENGVLAPESDYRIAPDLTRATQMMWWSNVLSRTAYGFITANEEGDINPKLIAALEQHRDEFAALGLDIDIIQSRTNI